MAKPNRAKKADPQTSTRGRPGGEESRARILESAGKLFAERGYSGVSTRELATAAEANVSAIAYYFRGKKGLYRAVVNKLIEDTEPFFKPTAEKVREGVVAADGDEEKLAELTGWLIETLLKGILSKGPMRWQMGLMLREFYQPGEGFPIILENRVHPMHDAISGLVAAATGRDTDDPETLLLTCCLVGQCMAFGAAQGVILARLNWAAYNDDHLKEVTAVVTHVVLSMLDLKGDAR